MSRSILRATVLAALPLLACASAASAHATLETKQAPADSYHKAVLRVPHGCEGSPTLKVRIQVPDGVSGVKPQPKPEWVLQTTIGKLATPYDDGHGKMITEGVTEVSWTGRLLDEHYDEFVMRVKLPNKPGEKLYFKAIQECEKGVHRWIEIPAAGKSGDDYKEPAPQLTLTPKQ
ncbi:MAG: YcnI family protein [Alphaproteobacteria bacterium]|nr:YcnI family protein [Alphaproteobacteria bacterium]